MLKPQDLLLCLKVAVTPEAFSTYASLGYDLGIGESEAYRSAQRAVEARLLDGDTRRVRRANLLEFVLHGAPYAFAARRGPMTRGMATGVGATPLRYLVAIADADDFPVWPDAAGTERGHALEPLYPSVPEAARRDPKLYVTLALVDALREGRARERALASKFLTERLEAAS